MIEGLLIAAVPVVLGAALKDGIPCASSTSGGLGNDKWTGDIHKGKKIYEGPRGGQYYLNDSGRQVYV